MTISDQQREHEAVARLQPLEQAHYIKVSQEAARLPHHPIYDRYKQDFLAASAVHNAVIESDKAKARAAGIVPDHRWLEEKSRVMRQDFVNNFVKNTLPEYGAEGKKAWADLSEKFQPKSLPGIAISQFFTKENGMKWAGVVGGLVGGWFIHSKLGGGVLGAIGTVLAIVAGAWIANKGTEMVKNFAEKVRAKDTPAKTPELDKGVAPQKAPEKAAEPAIQTDLGAFISPKYALADEKEVNTMNLRTPHLPPKPTSPNPQKSPDLA